MDLSRRPKAWEDKDRFFNWPAQLALLGFLAMVAAIELYVALAEKPAGSQESRALALAIALAALGIACRSLMAPSIEVSSEHLVLRDIHRTRRLRWQDISSVEVVAGSVGLSLARREFLVLHLADGTARRFTGLNAPVHRDGPADSRVHDALEAIQKQLRTQQRR